jgi:hypothetical protein
MKHKAGFVNKNEYPRHCSKLPKAFVLAATFGVVFWLCQANAYPPHKGEYLFWPEMPEASQVLKDMKGKNDLDTAARQHAGLMLLMALVKVDMNSKGLHNYTASENKLIYEYFAVLPESDGHGHVAEMRAESLKLQSDPSFVQPFLKRYFSEAALREIEPIVSSFEASAQKGVARLNAENKKHEEEYAQSEIEASNLLRQATEANAQKQKQKEETELAIKITAYILTTFFVSCGILWIAKVYRAFRPIRTTSDDPPRFEGHWENLTVNTFTGYVHDSATRSHTSVTGSIRTVGNAVQGGISSKTTVTDSFWLVNPRNQQERNFQVQDIGVPVFKDQLVSVAWIIQRHRTELVFIVVNHTSNQIGTNRVAAWNIADPRWKRVLSLYLITWIPFPPYWILVLFWAILINIQTRRFVRSGIEPLVEALNRKAEEFS